MVWPNLHIPPTPAPTTPPPRPDVRVGAVAPIKDQPQRRSNSEHNRRRRALFDFLMEEVEALPELEATDKHQIRENLRAYIRREAARRGTAPPPHSVHQPHPLPDHDHAEQVVASVAPEIPHETVHPGAPAQEQPAPESVAEIAEANRRLAEELRRILSVRTDTARKIAQYVHGLMLLTHEIHLVEIEV